MADELVPLTPLAPPRVRPRLRWRWGRRLAVLASLLLAAVGFAPMLATRLGLVDRVAASALADFRGTLRAGGASLGWFTPVEFRDVTVTDAAGRTILTAPKVTWSKTLLHLSRDRSDLGHFTIEQPTGEVVCEGGTTNVEQAIAAYLGGPTAASDRRTAVSVSVVGGTLTVRDADRSRARTLTEVAVDLTVPAPTAEPVTLRVRAATDTPTGPGTFDTDLSFGAEVGCKLVANRFPLDAVEPFVRRADSTVAISGLLTADVTAGLGTGDSGQPRVRLTGTVSATDLEVVAPGLSPRPVRLRRVELPCAVTTTGSQVRVEKAELACDLGRASVAGLIDLAEPVEAWLDRPGLRALADADLAAVAAAFPRLVRVRDGLELREGRIRCELTTRTGPGGTVWDGAIKTTALKGTHGGKPLVWEQPLEVGFATRVGPGRTPVFERLDVRSEFATVSAHGSPDSFAATADVSLDRLAARLSAFIDLGGLALGGTAKLDLSYKPNGHGGTAVRGTAKLARFVFGSGPGQLREPDLVLDVAADAAWSSGAVRLDTGRVTLTAKPDLIDVRLMEPVTDVRTLASGRVRAEVSGDLARCRDRLSRVVMVPADWRIAGVGKLSGTLRFDPARVLLGGVTGELTGLKFSGAGLAVDEPQVKLYPTGATLDRATGRVEIGELQAATQTVGLSSQKVVLAPTPAGYAVSCTVLANANLARVQRVLRLQTDPGLGDAVGGMVRAGSVTLDTSGGKYQFKASLPVDNFVLGPPQRPTWAEPKLTLAAEGEYDPAGDVLRLTAVRVARPEGLAADARGTIGKLSTTQDLAVDGTLSYDLSLLEPQLRAYLGPGVKVAGKDTRGFRVSGPLAAGPQNLSASVAGLSANAAVAWQSLRAYGFDVGRAELAARLDKGILRFDPVEAAFGRTGKVRLEPSVRFAPGGYDLTLAKGKVVDHAELTPTACADALGYALPAIARATEADGTVSFDLDESAVPLADPNRARVKGRLTLHQVWVGPGPVVAELAGLFGAKQARVSLATEQVVPIRLENGRVHHEGLALTANGFTVRTTGSVGLDGGLDLTAELPVPDAAIAPVLKNNPRIREAIAKKRFVIPVGGTIGGPKIDSRAFHDAVRRYTEEVAREAARNKLNDEIQKGRGKLEQELEKKLDKFLPPPKKD